MFFRSYCTSIGSCLALFVVGNHLLNYWRFFVNALYKKELGTKTDNYLSERARVVSADGGKHNIRQSLRTKQLLMRHFIISLFSASPSFCSASLISELRISADEIIRDEFVINMINRIHYCLLWWDKQVYKFVCAVFNIITQRNILRISKGKSELFKWPSWSNGETQARTQVPLTRFSGYSYIHI